MKALSSSEEEDEDPSKFGYSSDESSPPPRGVKNLKNAKVGLERGLTPTGLGKNTTSLFLEQIGDMTAYPRHNHHKTSESLGDSSKR